MTSLFIAFFLALAGLGVLKWAFWPRTPKPKFNFRDVYVTTLTVPDAIFTAKDLGTTVNINGNISRIACIINARTVVLEHPIVPGSWTPNQNLENLR